MSTRTSARRPNARGGVGGWARRWFAFLAVGLVLYLGFYAVAEYWVYAHGDQNRFHAVRTTPPTEFDVAVLGASHAMPLAYEDMNARLEEATDSRIMNLAMEGGGVLPNNLMLDYFLGRHDARVVLYVVDSFAFYSEQWNEERLTSADLVRAPLDLGLLRVLAERPWARDLVPGYLSGFNKMNHLDRFAPDVAEGETSFRETYRPIEQIDRRRIEFLYPDDMPTELVDRYFSRLRSLTEELEAGGRELVLVRPPIPDRVQEMIPFEDAFVERLEGFATATGTALHDHSDVVADESMYYDTDHLNREGVLTWFEAGLADLVEGAVAEADGGG